MLTRGLLTSIKNRQKILNKIRGNLRSINFSEKKLGILLVTICLIFWGMFIWQSMSVMLNIPFNEFDEAHRAENAKQMKEYNSLLVPLTGSPFDRVFEFRIPYKSNNFTFLYYHLERPPLVYALMVASTSVFGSTEWAYRLPSFIFGMLIFGSFWWFGYRIVKTPLLIAFITGLLCLLTSSDLWLSSQYAQLDTAMSFGLFGACLSLIYFCQSKKEKYLYLAGVLFGVAILSKGQPAIILGFPILYLLISKRLRWDELVKFGLVAIAVVSPWFIYLCGKFGLASVMKVFVGFAFTSATVNEVHHLAPFFWYARWWWVTMRPGWTLFLVLFLIDLTSRSLDWKKKTLLVYIFGSLAVFSLPSNKLWWYVLPLIPAIAFYIFLSLNDLLKKKGSLVSLALAIFLLSRPPASDVSNRVGIFYGVVYTFVALYMMTGLRTLLAGLPIPKSSVGVITPRILFVMAVFFSLVVFNIRFPQVIPYDWGIKPVATYYSTLDEPKCLWILDIPPESALYYSNAGEVHAFIKNKPIFGHCQNFLMASRELCIGTKIYQEGNMNLFDLDAGYQTDCSDKWVPKVDK